ncbi:MAG TPA: EF-hand domain-containing protein [Burkholderiaceae bacterium]|nr:EF-hand domain-containing protein [Burkholderiaceae bacterium]
MQRSNPSILSTAAAAIAVTLAMPLATAPAAAQTVAPAPAEAAFKRADANSDGKLSKDEAARLPAIAAKFDELDKDKDGFLNMAEFAAGYAAPK